MYKPSRIFVLSNFFFITLVSRLQGKEQINRPLMISPDWLAGFYAPVLAYAIVGQISFKVLMQSCFLLSG